MEHRPILPTSASLGALAGLMGTDNRLEPIVAVAAALRAFNREQLGSAIEVLIAFMDAADGDPDLEADDRGGESVAVIDDPDLPPEEGEVDADLEQTFCEDDFYDHPADGPGCPIADAGGAGAYEDDEDDELDGQSTEEEVSYGDPGFGSRGPGCAISDPDWGVDDDGEEIDEREPEEAEEEFSDPALRKRHLSRIQRHRCFRRHRYSRTWKGELVTRHVGYDLRYDPGPLTLRQLLRRKRGVPRRPRP